MKKEKVLRNPTQEDFNKELEKTITNGVEITEEEKIQHQSILKPKTSIFEPDPVKFKLPSGNSVVKKEFLTENNEIFVRRFTVNEESIFQSYINTNIDANNIDISAEDFITTINKMLNLCIKTNINVEELSIIDKIPLFIFIIGISYGFDHELNFICSECGKVFKNKINLQKEIIINYLPYDYQYPVINIKNTDINIYLTYPLVKDEIVFIKTDVLTQIMLLISKITGHKPDGNIITEEDYEDIIKNIPNNIKKEIKQFVEDYSIFGTQMIINKNICRNEQCSLFKKKQDVIVPIPSILIDTIF